MAPEPSATSPPAVDDGATPGDTADTSDTAETIVSVEAAPTLAMRGADTHRAVRGYAGAAVICVVGLIGLQASLGSSALRWVTSLCAAAAGLYSAWLAASRWRGGRYSDREAMTAMVLLSLTALCAVAFAGAANATAALLVILVAGLAMGNDSRGRVGSVVVASGYAIIGVLAYLGLVRVVPDADTMRREAGLATVIAIVELTLLVSYVFGRSARRSTAAALREVQRARLQLAGREALLLEARADLERVARGARAGRLTGVAIGDFTLGDVVGRGAMGEVYRAERTSGGSPVAIKVLHLNLVTDDKHVRRFFREAEVCSQLTSPHLVQVLDHGDAPDGSPYLAMEYLDGSTLSAQLRARRAPLPIDEVAEMVRQVAAGLAAAHAAGVVHRDIKPTNLMRVGSRPGTWKVLDFGISKLMAGQGTLTGDRMVGTPGFMSPEQAYGTEVDHRADVFALAAVAYRAITGVPAFAGPDPVAVVLQAAQQQPTSPRAVADHLTEDIELALALALAKAPEDRFAGVEDFAAAFTAAAEDRLPGELRRRARDYLTRFPWADPQSGRLPSPSERSS